jgi:uroporphyrinogen-III decarboxylase
VDIDFMVPLGMAREKMGPDTVLLGNLNPVACLRNGNPDMVRRELERCHAEAGRNYIVGAGCEVVRDTAHENVRTMVKFARSHSVGRQ